MIKKVQVNTFTQNDKTFTHLQIVVGVNLETLAATWTVLESQEFLTLRTGREMG